MAKTTESDATAAEATEPVPAPAASTPVATRASIPVLGVVGIAAGSVLAAGLLFGGGLAVGLALPDAHQRPAFAAGQLGDGSEQREGVLPNDRQNAQDRRDGQRPPFGDHRPQQGPQQPGPQQNNDAPDEQDDSTEN